MSMASEELLKKFDALFKNRYGLDMQRDELVDTVDRLVRFFSTLEKAHAGWIERQNKDAKRETNDHQS